ncbi:MAG: ABC transporter permease subunit, partial [Ruminiclostridium sp.]|nr:ABC transporter permease subunit [Ruminiclostridium sp.]
MDKFIANLQNELFKLRKRKKYLVFLLLGCAVCVAGGLRVLVANFITGELGTEAVSRTALLGNLMNSNLTFILLIFLPLMAIMASCDLFVGEQADHTMRFSLMRPVSKGKLFFSKAGAVFLLCAFDLAVMYAATTLTQLVLGGGTRG